MVALSLALSAPSLPRTPSLPFPTFLSLPPHTRRTVSVFLEALLCSNAARAKSAASRKRKHGGDSDADGSSGDDEFFDRTKPVTKRCGAIPLSHASCCSARDVSAACLQENEGWRGR